MNATTARADTTAEGGFFTRRMLVAVASWPIVTWASNVFLVSLPYKFTGHPDTQHIFGTIGDWLGGILGAGVGGFFTNYGAYLVGGFELVTATVLLAPLVLWLVSLAARRPVGPSRPTLHTIGGLMAAAVMAGAVFFHLFSPLGIEVLHQGESDGGSLFYAATSILVLGLVLAAINQPFAGRRHT